jgi:nucleoside-diphosphate-sugar epimerase
MITALSCAIIPPLLYYLYRVRVRLLTPHPGVKEYTDHIKITKSALDRVSYDGIDMLDAIPREPTGQGYAVIGGSGFVGRCDASSRSFVHLYVQPCRYIVRLLLTRGERNIRIIDTTPPAFISSTIVPIPGSESVTFFKADITDRESVRTALTTPFPSTNQPPTVVFCTAAVIRFWDRSSYTYPLSHTVNVLGTEHIVEVLSTLPSNEKNPTIFIYTSTAEIGIPEPHFMRLGLDWASKPWDKVLISDHDDPLPEYACAQSHYARSKAIAERVVKEANGKNGLRTGIVRPGLYVSPSLPVVCQSSLFTWLFQHDHGPERSPTHQHSHYAADTRVG